MYGQKQSTTVICTYRYHFQISVFLGGNGNLVLSPQKVSVLPKKKLFTSVP